MVLTVLAAALMTACGPRDPLALVVHAETPQSLARWLQKVSGQLRPPESREFDAALQEVRLAVMAAREATGSGPIEEAMCARIHGRSVRQVLILACESKLTRLAKLQATLIEAVETNENLVTKPGDLKSAQYLQQLRNRQETQLREYETEIARAEKRRAELAPNAAPFPKQTKPAPGENARVEIDGFIAQQRAVALQKFDDSPAAIVTDPAALPEPERSEFQERRAGARDGRVVIAVQIRDRWWIYDQRPELPMFLRARLELPEAERADLSAAWANWQAELWARRMASEKPAP